MVNHIVLYTANQMQLKDFKSWKRNLLFFAPILFIGFGVKNIQDVAHEVNHEVSLFENQSFEWVPFLVCSLGVHEQHSCRSGCDH